MSYHNKYGKVASNLVPILIFFYPILWLASLAFNFYVTILEFSSYIQFGFFIILLVCSLFGWISRGYKDFGFGYSIYNASKFVALDLIMFLIVLSLFGSGTNLSGFSASAWSLAQGLIFIVITKFVSDLHHLTDGYKDFMKWVDSFWIKKEEKIQS